MSNKPTIRVMKMYRVLIVGPGVLALAVTQSLEQANQMGTYVGSEYTITFNDNVLGSGTTGELAVMMADGLARHMSDEYPGIEVAPFMEPIEKTTEETEQDQTQDKG